MRVVFFTLPNFLLSRFDIFDCFCVNVLVSLHFKISSTCEMFLLRKSILCCNCVSHFGSVECTNLLSRCSIREVKQNFSATYELTGSRKKQLSPFSRNVAKKAVKQKLENDTFLTVLEKFCSDFSRKFIC